MIKKAVVKKVVTEVKEFKKNKSIAPNKKVVTVTKSFTKNDILADISEAADIPRKKIDEVLTQLQEIISAHVKQGVAFSIPGLLKIYVVNKPATKARKGTNPFTGTPTV